MIDFVAPLIKCCQVSVFWSRFSCWVERASPLHEVPLPRRWQMGPSCQFLGYTSCSGNVLRATSVRLGRWLSALSKKRVLVNRFRKYRTESSRSVPVKFLSGQITPVCFSADERISAIGMTRCYGQDLWSAKIHAVQGNPPHFLLTRVSGSHAFLHTPAVTKWDSQKAIYIADPSTYSWDSSLRTYLQNLSSTVPVQLTGNATGHVVT